MTPQRPRSPVIVLALLVPLLLAAGCGGTRVETGHVVPASAAASVGGREFHVPLPSGRATIEVSAPSDRVPGRQVASGEDLTVGDGALVGISWMLDEDAYPMPPSDPDQRTVYGGPAPVPLAIEADGRTYPVTEAGDLTGPSGALVSDAVWVALPSADSLVVTVAYDGLVQRLDVATGTVASGAANRLAAVPTHTLYSCRGGARYYFDLDAYGPYPYVVNGGWATSGHSWLLLRDRGDLPDGLHAGGRAADTVTTEFDTFRAVLVPTGRPGAAFTASYDGPSGRRLSVRCTEDS